MLITKSSERLIIRTLEHTKEIKIPDLVLLNLLMRGNVTFNVTKAL